MIVAKFAAVALIGYFLGAVPFGVMIARRSAKVDVTSYGSGKTGATNVLRVAGKKAAAAVVVFDVLKGFLPVVFAALIFNGEYVLSGSSSPWLLSRSAQVLAALAAIAGHKWSVFLHFGGGRGVATFFGGLMALCPPAALFGGEILFLGACLTRYASLGSISGAVAAYAILIPLTILNGFPVEFLVYALVGAVFIIVVHRDNIGRLLAGKERRIGERVKM
ncbi:MAG: glycerol-3-phosphate 1-O-acyltransferase PlsY [Chloroflexota bacterium]|nr:glycerol-3-phosphate 1-O-acyltransferase PlsY [Chloroflexota bacterium]